jgi:dUTP pyrophosphatase
MEGCFALICDRSGLAANWGVSRRGGVIDPDYDKEWKVILCYEGRESYCVRAGDRIAQVLFFPLNDIAVVGEGVEVLSTERTGGLGSTGA